MTICIWPETDVMQLTGGKLLATQFEKSFARTANWPVLSRLMRVDQTTYLPDAMLTKIDRASMAASLEVRVPLLDHRVIEFTAQIPEAFKYRDGQGKYILKKLLSRYVHPSLYERPKMGFGVPLDHWFRTELKDLLTDYLSTDRLKREGILNHTIVEEKVKEHLTGRLDHQYRLWSLLIWEMWRDRWLGA
jgi:asparagine synthase (glutamine-hydrolysing)